MPRPPSVASASPLTPDSSAAYAAGATPRGAPAPPPAPKASWWRGWLRWRLLGLALLLGAGSYLWWWLGQAQSLGQGLQLVSRWLPAGQQLELGAVTGSLRRGGRIEQLRWNNGELELTMDDLRLDWRLSALLERHLWVQKLEIARIRLRPLSQAPQDPSPPLEELLLPLRVSLPFAVQHIVWEAASPVQVDGLRGQYRFDGRQHQLEVDAIAVAQGQYQLQAQLQGAAPMALRAQLSGRLQADLGPGQPPVSSQAQARVTGDLAGAAARLQVQAQLLPQLQPQSPQATAARRKAEPAAMRADVQAQLAPWAAQPLVSAKLQVQALDLASLWPQLPRTALSGQAQLQPQPQLTPPGAPASALAASAWEVQAQLRNAQPGSWDGQRLPLSALTVRAYFDGQWLHIPQAQWQLGQGRLELLDGRWDSRNQAAQGQLLLHALNPALLHSALAAASLSGRVLLDRGADQALTVQAQIQSSRAGKAEPGGKGGQGLAIDQLQLQAHWQGDVLQVQRLDLQALQAQLHTPGLRVQWGAGGQLALEGKVTARLPGAQLGMQGSIAPTHGAGQLRLDWPGMQQTQQWLLRLPQLPGLPAATVKVLTQALAPLRAWQLQGRGQLQAEWRGGWHGLLQQLKLAGLDAPAFEPKLSPKSNQAFKLRADLQIPQWQLRQGAAPAVQGQDWALQLEAGLPQLQLQGQGALLHQQQKIHWQTALQALSQGGGRWQAQLQQLQVTAQLPEFGGPSAGSWAARLMAPLALQWTPMAKAGSAMRVQAGAGQVQLSAPLPGQAQLRWQPLELVWTGQPEQVGKSAVQLRSRGKLTDLPLAWANAWLRDGRGALQSLGLAGDLLLQADWDVQLADRLQARASLRRSSGDLLLPTGVELHSKVQTNFAQPPAHTPAGLRQWELRLQAQGEQLHAALHWDSQHAGQIQANVQTALTPVPGGWNWSATAPVSGRVRAELGQLGVWARLAPPGWRMAGSFKLDAALSGSLDRPQWQGQLAADDLALRSVVDGVQLQDGQLRAQLQGQRLAITRLHWRGGAGSGARIIGPSGNRSAPPKDGGSLTASGHIDWQLPPDGAPQIRMDIQAQLQALQVLVRADRQISLSGAVRLGLEQRQLSISGQLRTDRATLLLPEGSAPGLGEDVRVLRPGGVEKSAPPAAADAAQAHPIAPARPPRLDLRLDLGEDFAVQGYGLTSRLKGQLQISSNGQNNALVQLTGQVSTVQGRYRAWGQVLDVDNGLVRFNGPLDNPQLDILALRPNIAVRAGVQVSGSAKAPRVRLYSEPQLPDAETISWVVMGRPSSAGGAEAALLQQVALALLSGGRDPGSSLAQKFGLDEIGFKGPQNGEGAEGAALTLGKRLSSDLYVTYEHSLAGALGTLYVFYDLSRRLTLRGQTGGASSAVDLIYTVRHD